MVAKICTNAVPYQTYAYTVYTTPTSTQQSPETRESRDSYGRSHFCLVRGNIEPAPCRLLALFEQPS